MPLLPPAGTLSSACRRKSPNVAVVMRSAQPSAIASPPPSRSSQHGAAGGWDKCDYLKSLGFDAAIDYRAAADVGGLIKALREAAPKGVDVYFDNVGGDHLTAAIACANPHARMPICGMISIYNATRPQPGPPNMAMIIGRRIKLQGFLVFDHAATYPQFLKEMAEWISAGKIKYEETVMEGIEKAPDAFLALFSGGNTGKMLVKLA
jgi:NADPH-dependent curcumin reductase CurA